MYLLHPICKLIICFIGDLDFIRQTISSLQEQQRSRQKDFDSMIMQQKRLVDDIDLLKDCITDVDITTNQINSKMDQINDIRPAEINITAPSAPRTHSVANQNTSENGQFPPTRPVYNIRRRSAACSLVNSDIEEEET